MRNSIGKGVVKSLLGSPCRQLSESICPATGDTIKTMEKKYGAITDNVGYVQTGPGGPIQVWEVSGAYKLYSDNGPIFRLKPYGRWRISIHLNVLRNKRGIGGDRDILKCRLVRFRVDVNGNRIGNYDLIQKPGTILEGNPADADPTWTWDLTQGPFVFDDYVEIPEQDAYCFIGIDALFSYGDPQPYVSGTISGIKPYNSPVGGNSNSDPLGLFRGGTNIFSGPPPAPDGDWDLPLEPLLNNGAVGIDGIYGGSTASVINGLDARYGVGGWGSPRNLWIADFTAQRLSLTSLFTWQSKTGTTVTFINVTLSQGQPLTFLWDFGDGTTNAGVSPTYTYARQGDYRVKLTASDQLGQVSVFDQLVTISLVANFTFKKFFFNSGGQHVCQVVFQDSSIGKAVIWTWDFGDGVSGSSFGANPFHNYIPAGATVTVTMAVDDGFGNTSSISKVVDTSN